MADQEKQNKNERPTGRQTEEGDCLIIESNTIYEIDIDCIKKKQGIKK